MKAMGQRRERADVLICLSSRSIGTATQCSALRCQSLQRLLRMKGHMLPRGNGRSIAVRPQGDPHWLPE